MWAEEMVMYQIYPLGMCGAPRENDGVVTNRIKTVMNYIPHLVKLGVSAVYFGPVFSSDRHGYDTRDYRKIDERLGTNEDFKAVCDALHEAGIKIFLDGVFNHVGRGFFGFKDVQEKRWDSPYKDWFHISFDGNSGYNDGFWYEGWEGHYELVKLNLRNPAVTDYLCGSVGTWIDDYGIDGLRLDVSYLVDRDFLRKLRRYTDEKKPEFYLVGEILGGDYKTVMAPDMCHSATNYECYKGLYSSFNSMNLFEINHSLMRQFGKDPWCLYRGMHLMSFVDNHDVTRVASILSNEKHLPLIYALAFGMPGYPCIYYGSEWGVKGDKHQGDDCLRPALPKPEWNELTDFIAALSKAKRGSKALCYGDFTSRVLTNRQCVFERNAGDDRVFVAVNADENPYTARFDAGTGKLLDLITGEEMDFNGSLELPGYSAFFLRCV